MSADIQDLLSEITASVSSGIPNDSGSGKQQLLQSITKLQRAIETPEQYVQRLRMQVSYSSYKVKMFTKQFGASSTCCFQHL